MKVEILPVRRADLSDIDQFLSQEWTGQDEGKKRLASRERNWLPDNQCFGLRLVVDGKIAGYLGASYSLRPVAGAMERFCAIAPWFVKDNFRAHSLKMLVRLLQEKDMTFVNYTPSRPMFKLFTGLGFEPLDQAKLLMPPLLNLARFRPWKGRVVTDPREVRSVLDVDDAKIFDDHVGTVCRQLAIVEGGRVCYLAAGRRILRRLRFAELLHVSAPDMLAPQFERIVASLCLHFRAVGVASDERLIAGANLRSIRYKLHSPAVFKSARVKRESIDNLWSELAY